MYLRPPSFLLQRGCAEPISFLASRILLLNHSINQCRLIPSYLLPRTPNSPLTVMDMVRKGFGKRPLKGLTMERKRVEEFEKSLMWRLWMNQYSFTLGFLSQNSLWKLLFFRGYKGYLYWGENGMRRVRFFKTKLAGGLDSRLDWFTSSSHEVTERLVCTFCPVVL